MRDANDEEKPELTMEDLALMLHAMLKMKECDNGFLESGKAEDELIRKVKQCLSKSKIKFDEDVFT